MFTWIWRGLKTVWGSLAAIYVVLNAALGLIEHLGSTASGFEAAQKLWKWLVDSGVLPYLQLAQTLAVPVLAVGVLLLVAYREAAKNSSAKPLPATSPIASESGGSPPALMGEYVPHEPITAEWIQGELDDIGFETGPGPFVASPCVDLLQKNGIGWKDDARAFFDHVESRRQLTRAHRDPLHGVLLRNLDAKTYCQWGAAYFKAAIGERPKVLAEFREWLRRDITRDGFLDCLRNLRLLRGQISETANDTRTPDKLTWRVSQLSAWVQNTQGFCRNSGLSRIFVSANSSPFDVSSASSWDALIADVDGRIEHLLRALEKPPLLAES